MSRYDVDVKKDRDADGRLVRAGASWGETRPDLDNALIFVFTVSLFAAVAGGLWAAAVGSLNPVFGYGIAGLIVSGWLLFGLPGKPRAVYFHADGRMETPYGIYHHSHIPAIGGDHRHIVSIEARVHHQDRETQTKLYEVVILFSSGDLIYLSRNCIEWVAIKAAAQLTHALNALRREEGEPDGYTGAWAAVS